MKSNIIQGVLLNRFVKGIPMKVKILETKEVIEKYTRELGTMSQMYK
jgi:hypothetical protein